MPVTKEELLAHEIKELFSKTNLPELISLFNLLTNSYLLANSDHEKEDLANNVSLINTLKDTFYSIQLILIKADKSDNVLISVNKIKHN